MPAWVVPLAAAAISAVGSWISQRRQSKHNMQLAKFQAERNEAYLNAQNAYNTPSSQRQRFEDAGYNPNLFYGQGNPGNQSGPLSYPDIGRTNMALPELIPLVNQSVLTQSQVQATNAKTLHSYASTELSKLQAKVLSQNPLLREGALEAIVSALKSTAQIKESEADMTSWKQAFMSGNVDRGFSPGIDKMYAELDLLEQRFNLGAQDAAIKAQILKSKEFQNAILEVQKKFMTESDITPQHVLQFIQLLLMKML